MFDNLRVLHGIGQKAIEVICCISSFLEVVVENNCLGDSFRIKSLVSMLRNKELKVAKVAKQACNWMCSVGDIWPIGCEADHNKVRWEQKLLCDTAGYVRRERA